MELSGASTYPRGRGYGMERFWLSSPAPPVGPEPSEITWEVGLSFADDPFSDDVVGLLRRWHTSVGGWIIPRAFATVERRGDPPLMISYQP